MGAFLKRTSELLRRSPSAKFPLRAAGRCSTRPMASSPSSECAKHTRDVEVTKTIQITIPTIKKSIHMDLDLGFFWVFFCCGFFFCDFWSRSKRTRSKMCNLNIKSGSYCHLGAVGEAVETGGAICRAPGEPGRITWRRGRPVMKGRRRTRRCRPLTNARVRMADESGGAAGTTLHCIACGAATEGRMAHPLRVTTLTIIAAFHPPSPISGWIPQSNFKRSARRILSQIG